MTPTIETMRTAAQAHRHFAAMGDHSTEQFRAVYLDSRYRVIHEEVLSVGHLTTALVNPRDVFRPAVQHGAVAIIVAHNHPSGTLEATAADEEVTERLKQCGQILGIEVLDHLLIATDKYVSIMEWAS